MFCSPAPQRRAVDTQLEAADIRHHFYPLDSEEQPPASTMFNNVQQYLTMFNNAMINNILQCLTQLEAADIRPHFYPRDSEEQKSNHLPLQCSIIYVQQYLKCSTMFYYVQQSMFNDVLQFSTIYVQQYFTMFNSLCSTMFNNVQQSMFKDVLQ